MRAVGFVCRSCTCLLHALLRVDRHDRGMVDLEPAAAATEVQHATTEVEVAHVRCPAVGRQQKGVPDERDAMLVVGDLDERRRSGHRWVERVEQFEHFALLRRQRRGQRVLGHSGPQRAEAQQHHQRAHRFTAGRRAPSPSWDSARSGPIRRAGSTGSARRRPRTCARAARSGPCGRRRARWNAAARR